ncbi:hypothetical protein [Paenibacillus segetis]|uniref:ABC transporter permease n=1 Tax=Paenibacillus segetis TaxID=1325360 RepID=A0ABQ1YFS7_9BACL|nr:hypothetical protein [Paenibacillus segetis]GGH23172.1 hypothetical protein GCM10008013_22080 [Paenibacillus segetis]
MSSWKGVFRLVFEDVYWYFGKLLLLYITIPLTIVWILLGIFFGLNDTTIAAISGPTYFFVAGFSILGFKQLFVLAIASGSTRTQFMKVFYCLSLAVISLTILCLNVCQFVLVTVYKQSMVEAQILHPARLFLKEYQFLPYLWVDLMVGLALFGLTFLVNTILYRVGFTRSLVMFMSVTIIGLFLYYGKFLSNIFNGFWVEMNAMEVVTLIGAVSLVAIFATYPMMRHAPLHPRPKKGR